ncbi:DNA alkylation repair protein [bacterium K02(2017)]|nr:DNA alkylation repair protein [bacterium K02(2017)]
MPEPLKNRYTKKLIADLASQIKSNYKNFDSTNFQKNIFNKDWKNKELKDRMAHIAITLHDFLPSNFTKAIKILKPIAKNHSGFEYMFLPAYVEYFGTEDFKTSIKALEHFTPYSSSEFAVRPFIIKYKKKMMLQMESWAQSKNYHVRRLASEGCRPRLPWAMALPDFKKDPKAVLKIIKNLKNDPSEYVRRSVANNLNDISKDHPGVLHDLAPKWLGKSTQTDKLVKHACRSLLKQGDPQILRLFGYAKTNHVKINSFKVQKSVKQGERLQFSFSLSTNKKELGMIRLEYAVYFMKSNGKQARKVFKISEAAISKPTKIVTKHHSFKYISTRKYYTGKHDIAIIVNGKEFDRLEFKLI